MARLLTLIDQHAQNYYVRDHISSQGIQDDLDDPRTRYAAIRRHISRMIIDSIIMLRGTRYEIAAAKVYL